MDGSKIIIFTETKRGADMLTRQLRMDGWPALAIHGDKSQAERDWVLNEFRDGKNPIMIATDVAARGLGILLGRTCPLPHPPPSSPSHSYFPFILSVASTFVVFRPACWERDLTFFVARSNGENGIHF